MKHCTRTHKISKEQIIIDYYHDGIPPTCKCGCGTKTNLCYGEQGRLNGYFRTYAKGHLPRVVNNWGHNKKAQEKSAETRRHQYASGERKTWNDGLTKQTDERVASYGKRISDTINSNPDELKRRSDWLSNARTTNEKFKSKYGIDSANWKGGTSSINNLVRVNKRLYTEWIYPILVRDGFKCTECGSTEKLEVHHDKEQMSHILHKFVNIEIDYDFDQKRDIMNEVIDYHVEHNISGKSLCKECHKQLHPSYNT
jgi:hypothetical protein